MMGGVRLGARTFAITHMARVASLHADIRLALAARSRPDEYANGTPGGGTRAQQRISVPKRPLRSPLASG